MSLIWKFEEGFEMAVQFHVDVFHSIAENETVKKIATWKARHNTNVKPPFIRRSPCYNISFIHRSDSLPPKSRKVSGLSIPFALNFRYAK
jgi:hypothetical protein